jgi:zeta-carotene desaturase
LRCGSGRGDWYGDEAVCAPAAANGIEHRALTPDVIVIGGGFAGLSAATALADAGARVLVVEARPTLGGRASTFTDPVTGERVDNGQHVLFGCYDETFRLLRRVGTEQDVHLQNRLSVDIVDADGDTTRLACPPLPAPLHLLAGLIGWSAIGWRDAGAALRVARSVRQPPARDAARAQETVRQWLARLGQTPRLVDLLWEPLAVAALNEAIDVAAAAPFVEVLRRMFGSRQRDAALGLPLKPLDELYAAPSRAFVEGRGGQVRVGSPARVCLGADPYVEVRGERLRARAIVCAVPWYALRDLFGNAPAALAPTIEAASATAASPIVTVNLWLDRPVTTAMFVGLPGRAMQWVFDKRTLFGEAASHLSLVSSGADALAGRSNQDLIDLARSELAAALPAARGAGVRRAVVVREKRATFSVAPGQPPRPSTRTAVPGLFLAGDWIDTGLPATIESAVASGHAAARAVIALS